MRNFLALALCSLFLLTGCVAVMQKALLGKSSSEPTPALTGVQQAMAYPLYFGTYASPNTMIFYHNPQCPYSAKAWNTVRDFAERQSPADFKLVVVGSGFNEPGTWLLYYGAIVAEQDKGLARGYLSTVSKEIKSMPANTGNWTHNWQKRQPASLFDAKRANALIKDDSLEQYAVLGRRNVFQKYQVQATPTFIINGRVYKGKATEEGFTAFMRKRKPYAALP